MGVVGEARRRRGGAVTLMASWCFTRAAQDGCISFAEGSDDVLQQLEQLSDFACAIKQPEKRSEGDSGGVGTT